VLALIRGTGRSWQSLYTLFAVLCLTLLVLLVQARFPDTGATAGERIRVNQLGRLLKNPLVLTYSLGIFFYVGAEVGTASWIVQFFEHVHGRSAEVANLEATSVFRKVLPSLPALTVALFWGLQGAGRLVSGPVLNRFGSRRILRIYSFLAVISLLVADFASEDWSAVGFVACGFFTSVLFTLIFSGTINSFSENRGTVSGLLCTAILGGALLPPLVGWVGDNFGMRTAMMVPMISFLYVFGLSVFGRAKYE